jgi:hypothetical protein
MHCGYDESRCFKFTVPVDRGIYSLVNLPIQNMISRCLINELSVAWYPFKLCSFGSLKVKGSKKASQYILPKVKFKKSLQAEDVAQGYYTHIIDSLHHGLVGY